jgi:stage V sporulation protein B
MGKKKKSESGFLVQGSILAIASIISRIIGLLYRIPLTNIIGDYGNDYYGTAMEVYGILLLISSYSLPLAVSKLVSIRVAKGQRKNAYRIFKGALVFAIISGCIASFIVYFGASTITKILKTPLSIFALQVLAPTLLIMAVLGVIRGFFQGMGTMMPSAVSQLLEQIVNAVISVWTAMMLYNYGKRIGAVLGNSGRYGEAYGASGGTVGTGAGALFALFFVLFVLAVYIPVYKKQMKRDRKGKNESYRTIFKVLIITVIPVLLSTTIYNISSTLDTGIFKQLAAFQKYPKEEYSAMWGIFSGKYKTLVNVPIAIASALAASSVTSISMAFTAKDIRVVKQRITSSIRFTMVIAIPCAVGMGVLASPILQLTYRDSSRLPATMLQVGAVSIIFYSLSTISNAVLQSINKMRIPVFNAVIALVLHLIVLCVLMLGFDLNIYAVVIANLFFSMVMCVLNALSIRRYLRYRQELRHTFLIPIIAASIMGGVVLGSYYLLMKLFHMNTIAVITAIFLGTITYGVFLLLFKGMNEEDLKNVPKGMAILRLAKKLHLIK